MTQYPLPFTEEELRAAFPEYTVHEALGEGTYKIAYRAEPSSGPTVVLKIVKDPVPDSEQTDTNQEGQQTQTDDVSPTSGSPDVGSDSASSMEGAPSDAAADGEDVLTDMTSTSDPLEDSNLPERVRREIQAMKAVDSPRVAQILEGPETRRIGNVTCLCYFEPLYGGGTLTARLGEPISPEEVTDLARSLLEGVAALAAVGIVHRDIKPDNVLFGDDGQPVLIDLGIALHLELQDVTDSGDLPPRTEKYAAPEQFRSKRGTVMDSRTDLFQIGLLLFEALTGKHPFNPSGSRDAYIQRIEQHKYDRDAMAEIDNCEKLKASPTSPPRDE